MLFQTVDEAVEFCIRNFAYVEKDEHTLLGLSAKQHMLLQAREFEALAKLLVESNNE